MDRLEEEKIERLYKGIEVVERDVVHARMRLYSSKSYGNYWITNDESEIRKYLNESPYNPVFEGAFRKAVLLKNVPIPPLPGEEKISWAKKVLNNIYPKFLDVNGTVWLLRFKECPTIARSVDILAFDPSDAIAPYKLRRRILEMVRECETTEEIRQGNAIIRAVNIRKRRTEIAEILKELERWDIYFPRDSMLFNHYIRTYRGAIVIPVDNYRVILGENGPQGIVFSPEHPLETFESRYCSGNIAIIVYHPFPEPEADID